MGKHHRHRSSRSRSHHSRSRGHRSRRHHDSSNSRSHSHSRRQKEKHKSHSKHDKKFTFDSPPRDGYQFQQPIEKLIPQLPVQPQPNLAAFQNAQQVQQFELMRRVEALMNTGGGDSSALKDPKADKKLYVGNLPANITPQMLCDAINLALIKMNVNQNPPGNSALSAWISTDGHYAFVEFRTAQEATNAFCLNNVAIFGQPLKVGRPKQYTGNQAPPTLPPINLQMNQDISAPQISNQQPQVERIHPPSKILVLKNMIQQHELEIDEEFNEIKEDVKEECSKYGQVISIKIPRPQGQSAVFIYGIGKIFVEFDTVDSAKLARKNLVGRTFSNKTVECAYHSETKYAQNDFSDYY